MPTNGNGLHELPRSRLYLKTMELLRNRPMPKTLAIIEKDTGLPRGWLASISLHPEFKPSCDRIEILYEYLSGKQLKL